MSSDPDWRKWRKSEAYFGVVTCPEFEADRIAGNFDSSSRPAGTTSARAWCKSSGSMVTSRPRALDFDCDVGGSFCPRRAVRSYSRS
jgi:hypothetical protein